MPIRIIVADDDPLIRESLKIILGMDECFEVAGVAENGLQAVELCMNKEVDVALLDIRMPLMSGVQATYEICQNSKTKPLILTTFDDDEFITQAIKNGAKGYLLKNNPPERIKDAIKTVFNGNAVMQDTVMNKLMEGLNASKVNKMDLSQFSDRESEIMELISKGMSNKEISRELFISEGTVKNYITSILNKTGMEHRTQIAIFYLNGGKL